LATDALGNALRFILTGGERNDITQAELLVKDLAADHVIADKGYDAEAFVLKLKERTSEVVIPSRRNRKEQRETAELSLKCCAVMRLPVDSSSLKTGYPLNQSRRDLLVRVSAQGLMIYVLTIFATPSPRALSKETSTFPSFRNCSATHSQYQVSALPHALRPATHTLHGTPCEELYILFNMRPKNTYLSRSRAKVEQMRPQTVLKQRRQRWDKQWYNKT
jgi:transposase